MKTRAFPSRPEPLEARIAPATLFALTTAGTILVFDSATPGTIADTLTITGLGAGETVVGLDFRPAGGELLATTAATGSANNSIATTYRIDTDTGAATLLGATATAFAGWGDVASGYDFNPTLDRIRVVNVSNENARINPNNGALAGNDTDLTFTAPATGPIIGAAYDRNFVHSASFETTLYGIDRGASRLVLIGGINSSPSPNVGSVTSVGALGIPLDPSFDAGFEIENGTGTAFAALRDDNTNLTGLYTIDLANGAATLLGAIGAGGDDIRSLSAAMPVVSRVNATTATYTDSDGDRVTVKVSKGDLIDATLLLNAGPNGGGQLSLLDFNGVATFNTTNIKITVKKAGLGDGFANVGFIDATGIDLGAVSIPGDLGAIDAGDATPTTAAVRSLAVQSLGLVGIVPGVLSLQSDLVGGLGKLTVKTNVKDAFLDVTGGVDGKIGSVQIGGSIIGGTATSSGRIAASDDIGTVKIGRDLVGGSGALTGTLFSGGDVRSLSVGGSLLGGSGSATANVTISGNLGSLKIGRDVQGGSGANSGLVQVTGKILAATIGGDMQGSAFGSAKISGSLGIDRLTLGGSLRGGAGDESGKIESTGGALGTIKIGGNLEGGSLAGSAASGLSRSGGIFGQHIGSVLIGGSMLAGRDDSAGFSIDRSGAIIATDAIGSVTIRGDLAGRTGTSGTTAAVIAARGQAFPFPAGATTDMAIKSLTVGGRVERANILAGYDDTLTATNADAQIGKVTVAGDWIASNLVAGIQDDAGAAFNAFFGDRDDEVIAGGNAALVSRIGAIVIKGQVSGSAFGSDSFGFAAQQIGAFTVGKAKLPLTANTDPAFRLALPTLDVSVQEFAV
ncbi:MAG: DUF4394 domain-containing protein [Chthoniobacteraceae bacterium]